MIHDILDSTTKCKILNLFEATGAEGKRYLEEEIQRGRSLFEVEADIDVEVQNTITMSGTDNVINMNYYVNLAVIRGSAVVIRGNKYVMGTDPYK